jgi:protein-disulfide isomerase
MPDYHDEDGSQSPDERRTPGPGEAEALPEGVGRRGRQRALRIGAAITLASVVVGVIAVSVFGSAANPAIGSGATATQGIGALLAGIPQSANTLGSPAAPVTLQYFGDLECSTARAFTLATLPGIIGTWVRSGELRIEYRSLRTVSEPEVFRVQQVAALAAGRQDKLWYYIENFYHAQGREHSGYVTESYLRTLAREVPDLNLQQWGDDRREPQLATQVIDDEQAAFTAHLHNTPSFLIGRTGAAPTRSLDQSAALDPAAFDEAVRQSLRSQPQGGRHVFPASFRPLPPKNNNP